MFAYRKFETTNAVVVTKGRAHLWTRIQCVEVCDTDPCRRIAMRVPHCCPLYGRLGVHPKLNTAYSLLTNWDACTGSKLLSRVLWVRVGRQEDSQYCWVCGGVGVPCMGTAGVSDGFPPCNGNFLFSEHRILAAQLFTVRCATV